MPPPLTVPSTARSRSAASAHQEAVARRLADLCAQLGTVAPDRVVEPDEQVTDAVREHAAPAAEEWWEGYTHPPRPLPTAAPTAAPTPTPAVPLAAVPPVAVRTVGPAPEPGRHASRRPGPTTTALADLVPDTLRGRVRLGSAQLGVVALVVALGLAVVLWSVVRSRPAAAYPASATPDLAAATVPGSDGAEPSELPSGLPSGPPTDTPSAPPSSGTSTVASTGAAPATGRVTVDVAGRVRHPGIEVLPPGARVIDALRSAGGARPGVDLTSLNLARPLVDGEQILVGVKGSSVAPSPTTSSAAPSTGAVPSAPVDLNTATEEELESLPDVGPVTAGSILSWRQAHGRFTSVDELLEVDGIGDATLAKLTPYVTV